MNNARWIQVLNQELIFRDPAIQPRLHSFRFFWDIIACSITLVVEGFF